MLSAAGAASGGISPLTAARPRLPGVPFAQRTNSRPITSASLRGAESEEAASTRTGYPSAQVAEGPLGRGRMPASTREGPASPLGCGSHPPPQHRNRRSKGAVKSPGVESLEVETPVAQEGMEGESEVEVEVEPTLEETEE